MDPCKNPVDPNKGIGNDGSPASPSQRRPRIPQNEELDNSALFLSEMVAGFSSTPTDERFDLNIDGPDGQTVPDTPHFDERDFQSHRKENFPQTHYPLKPSSSRAARTRRRTTSTTSSPPGPDGAEAAGDAASSPDHKHTPLSSDDREDHGPIHEEEEGTAESSPLLRTSNISAVPAIISTSPKNFYADLVSSDASVRKVQFEVGGAPVTGDDKPMKKKIKARQPKYEDPAWRLRQGSQIDPKSIPLMLQGFDLMDMAEIDKDDLSSHRFQDNKGFRRHKFYPNCDENYIPQFSNKVGKYDHQPHEVFVEMDVLTSEDRGEAKEWKETARWIKYEEDVEEGADRWGKPHVASLSFHSLINLRRLLETGVLLLDLEEKDLPGIAYRVVEQMGIDDLIQMEEKNLVLRNLLLKHTHVHAGSHGWKFGLRRNTASLANLHTIFETKTSSNTSIEHGVLQRRNSTTAKFSEEYNDNFGRQARSSCSGGSPVREASHVALDFSKISSSGLSDEDIRWITGNENILRRIPVGSELALILVGTDDILQKQTMAFVRLAESVYMPNVTEVAIPVRFIFVLLGPSTDEMDYKEVGRSISTLMSNIQFHNIAYKASERKQLLRGIHEFLDSSIVIPPGDWDYDDNCFPLLELREKSKAIQLRKQRKSLMESRDAGDSATPPSPEKAAIEANPFKRTRRCFGGLCDDIRRRYPLYLSDIKDGLNSQCLATIIFLYFAAVSGAIAFGGLLETKTNNYIGIPESLIGTSAGGIIVALFGGQPLLIVGSTGPSFVYDESLFKFCSSQSLSGPQCLAVRTWIGAWTVVIGLIFVAIEGSVIVRFFTRFTQEIYATLISFVFIYESVKNLLKVFHAHPLKQTYGKCVNVSSSNSTDEVTIQPDELQPNVALFSLILMLGTFLIANSFKKFRSTTFFTTAIRKTLGNFGVLFAIVLMCLLDFFLMKDTQTAKLKLPDLSDGLNPSSSDRNWLISPLESELPTFWIIASAIPALLLFILLFIETSIAELIVEKKEYKLKKGCGFHLNIIVMCLVNLLMGYFGMCWISAASVRCVTHTVALTVYSTNNPPGEKPVIIGVKEQRVTALVVSILIGLSVLIADILVYIPMAVLYGVFLFMGISSMAGVQFLERVKLLFKQPGNYPQVLFVRRVRTSKMHLFTGIQVLCLVALWGVKESPAALSLPLLIFLLIPFRLQILPCLFKPLELAALDADGLEISEPKEKSKPMDEIHDKTIKYEGLNGKLNNEISISNGNATGQDFRSI